MADFSIIVQFGKSVDLSNIENSLSDINEKVNNFDSKFVPLSGTAIDKPITGDLIFKNYSGVGSYNENDSVVFTEDGLSLIHKPGKTEHSDLQLTDNRVKITANEDIIIETSDAMLSIETGAMDLYAKKGISISSKIIDNIKLENNTYLISTTGKVIGFDENGDPNIVEKIDLASTEEQLTGELLDGDPVYAFRKNIIIKTSGDYGTIESINGATKAWIDYGNSWFDVNLERNSAIGVANNKIVSDILHNSAINYEHHTEAGVLSLWIKYIKLPSPINILPG